MVAFSGSDPIGVLIGAKRATGTLIHTIAVHPDHLRQGHGRHLLASLGSKLAILGPPRLVAEVPETLIPACELFRTSGYVEEALLTDYIWDAAGAVAVAGNGAETSEGRFVIPVTVDDLVANELLEPPESQACWMRSAETLTARKDDIAGLAVASDERIEAYVLYVDDEIVSLRGLVDDDGAGLKRLLARLHAQGTRNFVFPKVHPAEASKPFLQTLGFRADATYVRYAAIARPD
jgi:L-amino acid N-acyltransferase YncA